MSDRTPEAEVVPPQPRGFMMLGGQVVGVVTSVRIAVRPVIEGDAADVSARTLEAANVR